MKAYLSSYSKNAALRTAEERDCMSSKAIMGAGSKQLLNLPLGSKLPLLPGSGVLLYTTTLGEKLHQPSCEFNLTDPNLHLLKLNYQSLHDPYLSGYYRRKDILKKLKNQGLITENNKIICTLKEFNQYRQYLTSIKLDFERKYAQEQRLLAKQLLNLQDQGFAKGINLSDLQEWLTNESKKNISKKALRDRYFNMIQTEEKIKNLIKEQKCCAVLADSSKDSQKAKELVHQIQQEELNMKDRSVLMRLEEDVKSEFNLEKRRRKAKEERARKRQESFERKMDHQIQKLHEFIERQEEYDRCRGEGAEHRERFGHPRGRRGVSKKPGKPDPRCLDEKWARLHRAKQARDLWGRTWMTFVLVTLAVTSQGVLHGH
ncbi:fibrous sheath-interacting protein 2-like [Chiloscyllium plagiosum]|uniref:fibrous sheath-interacting protein 2-like n=1 Tax=Chiloscyllium plagiosum TaxID=36176 RepID=UPI001CB84E0A|nr:fibrous sheath-interacting protein 2-like [Chiloscyllium plagiosum]